MPIAWMRKRDVKKMISALARRGPDYGGIQSWDMAVLGHRRLAIFDLSEAGRQPMLSADRSVSVVFNGAIYNYRELRKELIASRLRSKVTQTQKCLSMVTENGDSDKLILN